MEFSLESALNIRERGDGLYEKDTFDLPSSVAVDSNTIPISEPLPQPKAIPENPDWIFTTLDEANKQMQDVLTMPARLFGTPHPPMVSELATQTVPDIFNWLNEKEYSGKNILVKEADIPEEQKPYAQPAPNRPGMYEIQGKQARWEGLVEKGVNLAALAYIGVQGFQAIKTSLQINELARRIDKAANTLVDDISQAVPKQFRFRTEGLVTEQEAGWLKARADLVDKFRMAILSKMSTMEEVAGKWQTVAEGQKENSMVRLLWSELRAMGETGAIPSKSAKVGQNIIFNGIPGKISELLDNGSRVGIQLANEMGKAIVAISDSQLFLAPAQKEAVLPTQEAQGEAIVPKTTLTTQEAQEYLKGSRVDLKSSSGQIGQASNQTGLEGMRKETLDVAKNFSEKYGVDVTITGGTEEGHMAGELSHASGNKLDFGFKSNPKMSEIVEKWDSAGIRKMDNAPGYIDPDTGAIFYKEGNHWDVEVSPKQPQVKGKILTAQQQGMKDYALKYAKEKGIEITPEGNLVLYHGTKEGREPKVGENLRVGTYLTESKEIAERFANAGEGGKVKILRVEVPPEKVFTPSVTGKGEGYFTLNEAIKLSPSAEGGKPPINPPSTAVSGEPSPEEKFNKIRKDYIRATPIGKIISKSKEIKQELANEDFLIKSYEKDIAELEEKLTIEQFNTEAEKLKAQDKLTALKEKYDLAKETQRQKKLLRDEIAGLVKSIESAPKENISIEYQEMIDKIKAKFDLKRRTEATELKRGAMKAFVKKMKVEGRPINIPESELAILDKVTLNDMTLDQLREIKQTIDRLTQLGKTKLKAKEAVYTATKEKLKSQLKKDAISINSKELPGVPLGKSPSDWIKRYIGLRNWMIKTRVGLTAIEGLADVTGMQSMKTELDKSFHKYLTYNDEAITKWYNLTKDFTEENFKRVGAYAISKQEGGLERLANSGITEKEIKALKLSPAEEKAYKFVRDMFESQYPAIKQYAKDVYNEDVGKVENYVSFISDNELMSDLELYDRFGQRPEEAISRRTKTVEQGFRKERAKESKIKLELNIDKIFRRHMDDVAYMLNMGKDIKMYYETINSPEMREELGDVGTLAWLEWLDLMARKGGVEGAKRIVALDTLRRNLGAGVLAFRVSSALVQFSSFGDTMATIGAEWASKGARDIATSKEWRDFVMDNFPEVKKAVGDDVAFREFGEDTLSRVAKVGMSPLQFLDGVMRSTAIAGSYEKLCAEKGIKVDLKNPDPELIHQATKLMRQSQGSSFFKDQPLSITTSFGLAENRSVNKTLLEFQSFMLNRWDNINRQIWRLGIKDKNYKKAGFSLLWLLLFGFMSEELLRRTSRKITQIGNKNPRKEGSLMADTALNIIQAIPLLGQLTSSIAYSSNPVPVLNTINDMFEGASTVAKGKAATTKIKGGIKTLGALGSAAGIPGSSQVSQILQGWLNKGKGKSGWQ